MITFLSVEATSLALIGGAITIALGGFLRGFLGFGAALLIVPVLSALFGPEKALVITYFMEIPTIIYLMPNALKNGDVKTITPIVLALFCTIPIGIYFLITIDPEIVKIVISIQNTTNGCASCKRLEAQRRNKTVDNDFIWRFVWANKWGSRCWRASFRDSFNGAK